MRKYSYLLSALLLLAFQHLSAQNKAGAETIALPFVSIANNPVSMGGNQLLLSSTQWSSFSNPASVVFGKNTLSSQVAYQKYSANTGIAAGLSYKIGENLGLSAGFLTDNGQKYGMISENGEDLGLFSPKDMQINFGASYKVLEVLSAGVSAKYLKTVLSTNSSYSTVAIDAIVMADLGSVKAAAGVTNIGGKIVSFSLPASITAGVAYSKTFGKIAVKTGAETNYYFYGGLRAGIDAELTLIDIVSIRGGYNFSSDAVLPSFASVGLGLSVSGIKLDLSYLTLNGGAFALGVGYCF